MTGKGLAANNKDRSLKTKEHDSKHLSERIRSRRPRIIHQTIDHPTARLSVGPTGLKKLPGAGFNANSGKGGINSFNLTAERLSIGMEWTSS